MAEHVTIKIDVKADVRAIKRVQAQLLKLKATSEALEDRFDRLSGSINGSSDELDLFSKNADKASKSARMFSRETKQMEQSSSRMGRHLQNTQKTLTRFDGVLHGVGKRLQGMVKFTLKTFLLNLVGVGAALLTVSGAFTVANAALKVWNASLIAGAVAGASLISVLAGLAAGQREYNAALNAVSYGGMAKGTKAAMTQLRNLQSNAQLAVLGAEAVSGAFASISASTPVTGALNAALTKLGDFAAGSADPTKSLTAAGSFLGLLTKEGKLTDVVIEAAGEVGPAFQEAIYNGVKEGLGTSSQEVIKNILGGKYSGEFEGQLNNLNNTLFGTAQRNFQLIKSSFADLGQNFLPEFTVAIEKMARSIQTGLAMISGSVSSFAKGSFVDVLTNGFDKLVKGGATLLNKFLPKAEGAFGKIKEFVRDMSEGFRSMVDTLQPLLDGAQVLKDAFGPVFKSLFTEFGKGVQGFDELLTENRDEFVSFGQSINELFISFGDLFGELKTALVQVLPVLTSIAGMFTDIVNAVTSVVKSLNDIGSAGSWVAMAAAILGYGALGKLGVTSNKGRIGKGAMGAVGAITGAGSTAAMTINAGVVYLSGPIGAAGSVGASSGAPIVGGGGGKRAGMKGIGSGLLQTAGLLAALYGTHMVTSSTNAGGAVAGGAIAGAGIGTMFAPGVGTAIGAAGGALGGLAYDQIIGAPGREKAKAKASAKDQTAVAGGLIGDAISAGDYQTASRLYRNYISKNGRIKDAFASGSSGDLKGLLGDEAFKNATRSPGAMAAYLKELEVQETELRTAVQPTVENYNKNIRILGELTGKSADEIAVLAAALGDDLGTAIQDVSAYIGEVLGVTVPKNAEERAAGRIDAYFAALDKNTLPAIQQEEARLAVDAGAVGIREKLYSNAFTDADAAQFIRDAYQYEHSKILSETGVADPVKAAENLNAKIGTGGAAYNAGNQFAGLEDMLAPTFEKILTPFTTDARDTYAREIIGQIATKVFEESGGRESIDVSKVSAEQLKNLTDQDLRRLERLADAPLPTTTVQGLPGQKDQEVLDVAGFNETLDQVGIGSAKIDTAGDSVKAGGTALVSAGSTLMGSAGMLNVAAGNLSRAAGSIAGMSMFGPVGAQNSTMTNSGRKGGGAGGSASSNGASDTPTSRLRATLGKHAQADSMVKGKRMITSTIRGNNLGSLGSDHLSGNAYDIMGQNLGSYSQAIKSMGGFAEFHDRGTDRHLHVVPGQGDTMSPAVMPATTPVSMGGDSISIAVYGVPGMDVNDLANAVMRKLAAEQRSARERVTVTG